MNAIFYTPYGLRLDFSAILRHEGINDELPFVLQHWQAAPKPRKGQHDLRNFGYFIWDLVESKYLTIPAELIYIEEGIKIQPLQSKEKFKEGVLPTAVNYFENSRIITDIIGCRLCHSI